MRPSKAFIITLFSSGLAFVGGAFAVFGEFDDAPGLILLGLIITLCSVGINYRNYR
ncbi:MAG: hypothetical protein ACON47_08420 [Flavobacteriaceae bacterium]